MKNTLFILLVILSTTVFGHGVNHVEFKDGYGVRVYYEDGNPLDFADVQIFRPGESEIEYQIGVTDEHGSFMFKPDTNGLWEVKVSDGLGHGKVIHVMVAESHRPVQDGTSLSRLQKIISGFGYILFGFSIWYFFTVRRKGQHAHS